MDRVFTLIVGAGGGIGRAIAMEAAKQGHDLAISSHRDAGQLDDLKRAAKERGAGRVFSYACDLADPHAIEGLFDAVNHDNGPITGLVNSAGYTGERVELTGLSLETIDRILAVNVRGVVLCCRCAIAQMSKAQAAGGGSIVNLSSQSARFGGDRLSVYSASKAAIDGLTVSLAREVARLGIRVNAVSPGPVLTASLRSLPPEKLKTMQESLPFGRFCEPEEVAATVLWLLSPAASYVSGAIVPVHGAR